MNKIFVDLKYCYGINKLKVEFDFSVKRTYAIYSPNGVMKTSFAKTFIDLSHGKDSVDLVFPDRVTKREITDESGSDVKPEEIFVIEPYNEQFNTDKVSTLLVTKELKEEYDKAYQELETKKNEFIKKLKNISQSTDCESEFLLTFSSSGENNFLDLLSQVLTELDGKQIKYNFRYNDVFDKKGNVKKFLDKHRSSLELYSKNYESLISKSNFFKKSENTFGTYQATEILRSVSDNSFFDAGHSFELTDQTKIGSVSDFKNLLDVEIKKVVSDEKLKKIFEKVDKDIGSNVELRAFKSVIEKNNTLLLELKDYESFKKKVWLGYLDQLTVEVQDLLNFYNTRKSQLEDIVSKAKKEKTDWERSIEEFNDRFKGLPFRLTIKNREDVLLKTSAPTVEFLFSDSEGQKSIERGELLKVLSQGERRALYLLNIIFEVQARKKNKQTTLFIIDDIADSFDYKNKYAIIEYLNDISKEGCFGQLILTHNFDFYRCVSGRLYLPRNNRLNVVKTKDEIKIVEEKYQNNPFKHWKDNLDNNSMLIASIPFVRNLAEYAGYKDEFEKLTSLLHIKTDSQNHTILDLEVIYKIILKDKNNLSLSNGGKKVIQVIYESANTISQNTDDVLDLENKIVLSIAIRLKSEEFMIKKINDQSFVDQISVNQTVTLINKYEELFAAETSNIDLLEQVNLMTPENIHINSFMYEPILDLGDEHLKDLYKKVSKF
ncbi:hypothetical protein KO465_06170 [Candidatus Micrarchaeota archaeon]|jgi:hypothetical protein|nr:hypothetical protein [Candidatus Micrarchaeota archaeon]